MKDTKEEVVRRSSSLALAAAGSSSSSSNLAASVQHARALKQSTSQQQQQPNDSCSVLSLLYPFVDETKSPLPRCWSGKDKYQLLSLTHNDLRVHYKGQGKSHKDAAAVRAAHCIPTACGLYYFEVRIINKGRDGLFGIGLSQAGVSLNRLPGWDKFSYGYHGDDGHSFSFSGSGVPYGPTFSTGDVIGCGLNLVDNYCFYTKNGHNVGVAFTDLPSDLYPTVGLQTPGEVVEANFGQHPFLYDIYDDIKMAQQKIHGIIDSYCLPLSKTDYFNRLISSYLVHHGYSTTAESFNKLTNQVAGEDMESVRSREKILKLIMNGRIGEAIKQVHSMYPGLLEQNRNLLFLLKCRQFVEMVAGHDEVGCPPLYDPSLLRHYSATHGHLAWASPRRHSPQAATKSNSTTPAYTPPHRHHGATPRDSPRNSPRSTACGFASYVSVNGAASTVLVGGGSGERRASFVDHSGAGNRHKSSNTSSPSPTGRRSSDAGGMARNGCTNNSSDDPIDGIMPLVESTTNGCSTSGKNGVTPCDESIGHHGPALSPVVDCDDIIDDHAVPNGNSVVPDPPQDTDVEMSDAAIEDSNNNAEASLMSVDSNVALVHFGRELHQLAMQMVAESGRGNHGGVVRKPTAVQEPPLTPRLKMMQDAFSLMAYTDPWKSPLAGQLMPEQREPIAAALNSYILESRGFAAKPPLEVIFGHAQKLREEMIKIGLGAAAFTDPLYYTTP